MKTNERTIVLKNQINVEELLAMFRNQKPFVVMTKEGDYFFDDKEEAKNFARARNGFLDETKNRDRRLKGGDKYKRKFQ